MFQHRAHHFILAPMCSLRTSPHLTRRCAELLRWCTENGTGPGHFAGLNRSLPTGRARANPSCKGRPVPCLKDTGWTGRGRARPGSLRPLLVSGIEYSKTQSISFLLITYNRVMLSQGTSVGGRNKKFNDTVYVEEYRAAELSSGETYC